MPPQNAPSSSHWILNTSLCDCLQALGDRVSAFFVPAVCAAALVTWLAWFIAGEHAHIFRRLQCMRVRTRQCMPARSKAVLEGILQLPS